MKKIIALLLTAALLCTGLVLPAAAADGLTLRLSVNGETEFYAKTGDVITVTYTVLRGGSENYSLNAIQDEIKYNQEFFELDESSITAEKGRGDLVHKLAGDRIYLNDMMATYAPEQIVGTFQLKVIATQGSGKVESTETLAFDSQGASLPLTLEDLTVIIGEKSDSRVTFDTQGGSDVPAQNVPYGQKAKQPQAPSRKGYTFAGWFAEAACRTPWDFDTVIYQNRTLYAGWTANRYTVAFDAAGGTGGMEAQSFVYGEAQALRACAFSNGDKTFAGWALSRDGKAVYGDGQVVSDLTDQNGGTVTLYAVWQESGSNTPVGPIKPTQPTQPDNNGSAACDGGANCPSRQYEDITPSQWHHEAVDFVVAGGLMNGLSDTRFAPDGNMTRAMLVTVLYRLAGSPASGSGTAFTDVVPGSWYEKAVAWASENGIAKGVSDTRFAPNDLVTREQIAAMLYRYTGWKGYALAEGKDITVFADGDQAGSYAVEALRWAVAEGLIQGREGNRLAPTATATRAEVATILMRYSRSVAK